MLSGIAQALELPTGRKSEVPGNRASPTPNGPTGRHRRRSECTPSGDVIDGERARAAPLTTIASSTRLRGQRLLSTAVLGFALSEVAGRFDAQTARQRDADFELLLELLTESIQSRLDD